MAKFVIRYHKTGAEEEFEFDGTRQEFIDHKFGIGGVNATFATVEEVKSEAKTETVTVSADTETVVAKKETFVEKVKKAIKK